MNAQSFWGPATYLAQDERAVLLAERQGNGYAFAIEPYAGAEDFPVAAARAARRLPARPRTLVALVPLDPVPLARVPLPLGLHTRDAQAAALQEAPKPTNADAPITAAAALFRRDGGGRYAAVASVETRHIDTLRATASALDARLARVYHPADALAAMAVQPRPDDVSPTAVVGLTDGWCVLASASPHDVYYATWDRRRRDAWADQVADALRNLRSDRADHGLGRDVLVIGDLDDTAPAAASSDRFHDAALTTLSAGSTSIAVAQSSSLEPGLLPWLAVGLDRIDAQRGLRPAITFPVSSDDGALPSFTAKDGAAILTSLAASGTAAALFALSITGEANTLQARLASDQQHASVLQSRETALKNRLNANLAVLGNVTTDIAAVRQSGSLIANEIAIIGSDAIAHRIWINEIELRDADPDGTGQPLSLTIDSRDLHSLGSFETSLPKLGFPDAAYSTLEPEQNQSGHPYLQQNFGKGT